MPKDFLLCLLHPHLSSACKPPAMCSQLNKDLWRVPAALILLPYSAVFFP